MHPSRRPFIAGNWKMNLSLKEAVELVKAVVDGVEGGRGPEVMIAPPFTKLAVISELLKNKPVKLGAQDMHWEASGAYTGEVSPLHLKDVGCTHVILGHSERRKLFGETDASVRKKVQAAIQHKLVPVVCIGETLEEREAGRTLKVLETQVKGGLEGFAPADLSNLIVAYEPVWAIGTGKVATAEQAQEAHAFIRKTLADLSDDATAERIRIQYGGSVKPDNARELMTQPDIDGALVGGASLDPRSFAQIIQAGVPQD